MASLPVVIFQFALSPYEDWQQLAWTGALLITVAVLALSIIARVAVTSSRNAVMNAIARPTATVRTMSRRIPIAMRRVAGTAAALQEKMSIRDLDFFYGDLRR